MKKTFFTSMIFVLIMSAAALASEDDGIIINDINAYVNGDSQSGIDEDGGDFEERGERSRQKRRGSGQAV